MPGVESVSLSGGEAPENDVVTFQGVAKVVGHPRVPSVQAQVSAYNPQHSAWREIATASRDRKALTWRFTTQEDAFYTASGAGNTAAIAATGVVTFAGTKPDFKSGQFGPGMSLKIGPDKYVIDAISDTGVVTVKPAPPAAVAAKQDYKIVNPALRLGPFIASVRSVGNIEMAAEGQLTTTLDLAPRSLLPDWGIV